MVRRSECNHPLWNMNPQTPSRRPRGHLAVIALFIVLFLHAVLEATQRAQDPTGELAVLLWMQVSEALICLTVLVGLIRRSPWRPIAIVVWGVYSAAFVVALGPVLGLPPAARSGLLGGAAVILALTALCWWYVRRDRSVGNDVSL